MILNSTTRIQEVHLKYSLLYHYCCLVGVVNIVRLLSISDDNEDNALTTTTTPSASQNKKISVKIDASVIVNNINVSVDLPEDIKIFVRVDFLNYKFVTYRSWSAY